MNNKVPPEDESRKTAPAADAPGDHPAALPAPQPEKKTPAPEDDWWEDFRRAVEDPNVNIYEYLRDHALGAMDMDNKAGLSENMVRARKVALRELLTLTKPEEISKKLKALEGNALLFNPQARAIMRVTRAVVDTYVKTDAELKEREKARAAGGVTTGTDAAPDGKPHADIGATLAKTLKSELDEAGANPALESLAETFKDKNEEDVAATIREAARQLGEDRSLKLMMRDAARFARAYLTAENLVNIAIIALPLVTWQYRWALALGLGAYAGRKSVYYGYKAGVAHYRGRKDEARKHGQDALAALKAAGGNVLLIGLSPVLARYPAMIAGLIGFAVDATYNSTIDFFKKMLKEEEEAPGSTPVGKRLIAGARYFFTNYKDAMARLGAKALKTLAPHTVTATVEQVVQRLPFSKMQKIARRGWMLGGALTTRFNKIARLTARRYIQDVRALGAEVAEAASQFRTAVEEGLTSAAIIGAEIRRKHKEEQERAAARAAEAEEEARRRAEEETQTEVEEIVTVAEVAENDVLAAERAQEAFNEAAAAEAAKRRKLESMARHREQQKEQQKKGRTLTAKPD
jgi:hypothetical protein